MCLCSKREGGFSLLPYGGGNHPLLFNRSLEHLFYDIELLNVLELEAQSLLAGEAHSKKGETITGHIEGAIRAPSFGSLIRASPKIGGCSWLRLNKRVNVSKNVIVTLPKILSYVLAIGDCCVVLDCDDQSLLPLTLLMSKCAVTLWRGFE